MTSARNEAIRQLSTRLASVEQTRMALRQAITALQAVCEHDWTETGYDPRGSSTTYETCRECGLEKRS